MDATIKGGKESFTLKNVLLIALFTINASILISSQVSASTSVATECFNCSSFQTRALANEFSRSVFLDTEYFVLDRSNNKLTKYIIIRNPFLGPENKLADENNSITALLKQRFPKDEVIIIDSYDITENRSSNSTVVVFEVQPDSGELSAFVAFDDLVEGVFGIRTATPNTIVRATRNVSVPFGAIPGINSGFDLINNQQELNVGLWIVNNDPSTSFFDTLFSNVSQTFGNRVLINYEYVVFVTFPDGSNGVWTVNNRDEIDLISGTLRDSNNNVIPQSSSEIPGGFFFPGFPNNPNAPRMGGLIDRLGGVGGSGNSGGGGGGDSCSTSFDCDDGGNCTAVLLPGCT